MRKILVFDPFCNEHLDKMRAAAGEEYIVEQLPKDADDNTVKEALKDTEIVVGQPALKYVLEPAANCPKLKFIQMTWAGTDQYTRGEAPFPKEQIALANASGAFGGIMSQFVVGMIMSLMFNFRAYNSQQEQMIWEKRGPVKNLEKAKVIIYGAGNIGTTIAKRLTGFDTYTIGVCRNTAKKRPYFDELCELSEAEKFLPEADVVIGCIPNSDETAGYMNYDRLMSIKKGGIIVNVGRGNFIDCMALDKVLNDGHLWGAALDVTSPEPLPANHPLWKNPRCMITPHASGVSFGFSRDIENSLCDIICDNIARYNRKEELNNRIY